MTWRSVLKRKRRQPSQEDPSAVSSSGTGHVLSDAADVDRKYIAPALSLLPK